MDSRIRAVETEYHGRRFRSRLEARWAVFLDAIDVRWEYEHEGFELPDGGRYLPDFWLPGQEAYLEVKPEKGVLNGPEGAKVQSFSAAQPLPIYVVCGTPGESSQMLAPNLIAHEYETGDAEHPMDVSQWWTWLSGDVVSCPTCHAIGLSTLRLPCSCMGANGRLLPFQWRVHEAIRVARRARFEFGEHGRFTLEARSEPALATPIYLAGKFPSDDHSDGCSQCEGRIRCKLGHMCPLWHWRAEMWHQASSGKDTLFYGCDGYSLGGIYQGFAYAGPNLGGNSNHGMFDHGIIDECMSQIRRCTSGGVIFAWVHRDDLHGTLIEIGYAIARGIPVFVAFDSTHPDALFQEWWFARGCAEAWCSVSSPELAWEQFRDWWAVRSARGGRNRRETN